MNDHEIAHTDAHDEIGRLQQRIAELERAIEDRQRIEKSLHRELDFAMKMLHTSQTFFVTLSPAGKTLLMNETMLHALDYAQEDITGKDFVHAFIRESDHDRARDALSTVVNDRTTVHGAFFMKTRTVTALHVEWHFRFVLTSRGDVDYIFGTGIDISGHRGHDEAKFRTLFEDAGDAILVQDGEGHLQEVNRTACEELGYSREELLNMHVRDIEKQEYAGNTSGLSPHVDDEKPHVYETVYLSKDRKRIPVEVNRRTIEYGGKNMILTIARKIAERRGRQNTQ